MVLVATRGSVSTGHACFPPMVTPAGSANVKANGIGINRVGDGWVGHLCMHDDHPHGWHTGVTCVGSSSVMVNGRPAGYIGSLISCGDHIASTLSVTVFVRP